MAAASPAAPATPATTPAIIAVFLFDPVCQRTKDNVRFEQDQADLHQTEK